MGDSEGLLARQAGGIVGAWANQGPTGTARHQRSSCPPCALRACCSVPCSEKRQIP